MKCPVCKTVCDELSVCPTCGFTELNQTFINKEEAEQWLNNVVIPYKNNYYSSNVLGPVDWLETFKQNPQAKRLFEFSIPVTIKRRNNLESFKNSSDEDYKEYLKDATLGHIAIVSKSEMIREHFLDVVNDMYLATTTIKRTNSRAVEQAGDLAAILSNLQFGGVLGFEVCSKMKKDVVEAFAIALKDFGLDIVVGKGQGARSIYIELPPFTTIFIAEKISAIPAEIVNTLDAVVEFDPSQDELLELQIREAAPLYEVQLTKATIEVINECYRQATFKNIRSLLKYISEYLYLHTELQQPISAEAIREIVNNIS